MYNQKYVRTSYYEKALLFLKETKTSEQNKIFLANVTASLLENNPELNAEHIISKIKNLQEISFSVEIFDNTEMMDLDGFHDLRTNSIYINPFNIKEDTKLCYITLAHEFIHHLSNDGGIRGLENELYPNLNESFTQINAYNICKDLGIETFETIKFNNQVSYPTYGPAYDNINRVGSTLLSYKKEDLMKAFFNPDSEFIFSDTINRSSFKNLEKALDMERYQFSLDFFIESKIEAEKCKHNILLLDLSSREIDFEKYFNLYQENIKNEVYSITNEKYTKNLISSHIAESDIMMWGLSQGMDIKRLNSEIGGIHSENIINFVQGMELLKRSNETFTLEDIKNAKILKIKENDLEYITVQIKDKEIKGIGRYINNEYYISSAPPDNQHAKTSGEYKQMVFEEKDLTAKISNEVVFDSNAIYHFILNKNNSEIASLYASYEGLMTGNNAVISSPENVFRLFQMGKLNDSIKNFDISSLDFQKDSSGKMGIEYKLEEPYHWRKALYTIYQYSRENKFKDFPFEIDIEHLSKKHGTNILTEICFQYSDMLPAMVERGNVDLNFRYNDEDIISNFYKQMRLFHFPGERGNYTWLIKNGIDLFVTTPEGVPFYEMVLKNGNLADLKELIKQPNFTPETYQSYNQEKSIFELVIDGKKDINVKINELINQGFDINMENKKGFNVLESFIINKENFNESFFKKTLLKLLNTNIDLYHCANSEEKTTTGNYLASFGDKNLIEELITRIELEVKLSDIFNSNIPTEWLDKYTFLDMENMKSVQENVDKFSALFEELLESESNNVTVLYPRDFIHQAEMYI